MTYEITAMDPETNTVIKVRGVEASAIDTVSVLCSRGFHIIDIRVID